MGRAALKARVQVIVVEDDDTFLSFWRRFLEGIGIYDVKFVSNPYEAKDLLERVNCDLLISDINMKGLNGYDLAKFASEQNPGCRVILTTAYGANLSRFDLANCSFHLLYKPYNDLAELAKFVRHLLAGDTSFDDISEDSWSENEDYPQVTEWKL
jgi:DNA-binding NtrC family response regulator